MSLRACITAWIALVIAGATMLVAGVPAHHYILIVLGQTEVYTGICGAASCSVIRAIRVNGRPADEIWADGFDSGYVKRDRELTRGQVRHLRPVSGERG